MMILLSLIYVLCYIVTSHILSDSGTAYYLLSDARILVYSTLMVLECFILLDSSENCSILPDPLCSRI
jgi:hypothetical protein